MKNAKAHARKGEINRRYTVPKNAIADQDQKANVSPRRSQPPNVANRKKNVKYGGSATPRLRMYTQSQT